MDTQIYTPRYQKLERYLKNGQWEDADKETFRVMTEVLQEEKGDLFKGEELLNFPCDVLLAIDGLWVKYSQGRFGFTVQKEIIRKCGYKLDGSEPSSKVWYDFLAEVGWGDKTCAIIVPTYIIDTNTRIGALPTVVLGWDCRRDDRGQQFFSRMEICGL